MTRKLVRKADPLRSILLFFAVLKACISAAAPAQGSSATLPLGRARAASVRQSTSPVERVAASSGANGASAATLTGTAPDFLPVVTYDSGGTSAGMVAVADVNRDGKPDIVVINCGTVCFNTTGGGSVGVMLGNGNGTFQTAVTYGTGGASPVFVAVADVNDDGKFDLVVANRCGNNGCLQESLVAVLLGNGDGTFQAPLSYGTGGLFTSSVAVADLNGDGKPDIVVANNCGDSNCDGAVDVLLGNGDGTFQAAVTYRTGGLYTFSIVLADVNGDRRPDVVVTTSTFICESNTCRRVGVVAVLLGLSDGTFLPAVGYRSGGRLLGGSVTVADVNSDGKADIVVENSQCCRSSNGVVGVLLGKGDGTFKPVATHTPGGGGWGTSAAVADVNGDRGVDLITTDQSAHNNGGNDGVVSILLGNGHGNFQPAVTYSSGGFSTNWVAVADVNEDGRPDLVVANECTESVFCTRASVGVLLNNTVLDTTLPVITASVVPAILSPPDGRMVPVTVTGTISDAGSGVNLNTAQYAVHDEYGILHPAGKISPDATGNYSFTVLLRAARHPHDLDGRQYTIQISAKDYSRNLGVEKTLVIVPH